MKEEGTAAKNCGKAPQKVGGVKKKTFLLCVTDPTQPDLTLLLFCVTNQPSLGWCAH